MVVNSQLITRALAENEAARVWNVPLIVSVPPNISQKPRGKVFLHASQRDEVWGKVHSLLGEAREKVCLRGSVKTESMPPPRGRSREQELLLATR